MLGKILIANRGEIACRVIRTARRLGIRTVAVYSDADAGALHVAMADEAYPLGAPPARESYLNIPRVVEAAQRSGAAAIHPGYGFLAENPDFAAACEAAGIVFIGPSAATIRALGSKAEAKSLMEKAKVPLLPGYHGADQSDARLVAAARATGYPVLLKPSAGGGGTGMRVVESDAAFAPALATARREAAAAFGDERMLIEKYLASPRHIEVQVFADRQGNVVHLFERDCSVQRRHQKLIEEAPAPGLSDAHRAAIAAHAVTAARAARYLGAGTVEFVAEEGKVYFIEMNTRLQVEHVVTEMITGLDLVEWQIRIAAGEALPLAQKQVRSRGHAVEARLYVEDPARDFLPGSGTLRLLRLPAEGPDLRVETGFRQGDTITPFYDAMIAKLVAWGEDRNAATQRLAAALVATRIAGVVSNRDFLLRAVAHPAFLAGEQDTGFIQRQRAALLPTPKAPVQALITASCILLRDQAVPKPSADPHSPWQRIDGWRLFGEASQSLCFRDGEDEHLVRVVFAADRYRCEIGQASHDVHILSRAAGEFEIMLDGERFDAAVYRQGSEIWVALAAGTYRLTYRDPLAPSAVVEAGPKKLAAPLTARVSAVLVSAGSTVKRGQILIVLEAMKMEHAIASPANGEVERVNFAPGDLVEEGAELIAFTDAG